jgi:hypothetical protein
MFSCEDDPASHENKKSSQEDFGFLPLALACSPCRFAGYRSVL